MAGELSADAVIALARECGISETEVAYAGPGRTEGHVNRALANALDFLAGPTYSDAFGGDVEAPTGYFSRIAQFIVVENSQGFVSVTEYASEAEAEDAFADLEDDFYECHEAE
jgi:hypothetical protein